MDYLGEKEGNLGLSLLLLVQYFLDFSQLLTPAQSSVSMLHETLNTRLCGCPVGVTIPRAITSSAHLSPLPVFLVTEPQKSVICA